MAAPSIAAIMGGVDTRLATITGLRHTAYIADQINPPQAVVHLPENLIYDSTFKKGMMEMDINVTVLVSAVLDRIGQPAIGTYMDAVGAKSVMLAIAGDATLGGVVDDCYVESSRPLNQEEVNGLGYYGARFLLKILCKGS